MLELHQFPCLSDNYGFLLHDSESGETVAIDTPDADAYLKEAAGKGWQITQIWNTHWHPDHVGGNEQIRARTGCRIVAPAAEADQIGHIDLAARHGDLVDLGSLQASVIDVGGHTNGHIAYHLSAGALVFVGDALFPLGCGRMFEGNPPQFWASLSRLKALPPETRVYSAHEYAQGNARFALHADPENEAVQVYAALVDASRAEGLPTVPTTIERELAANPFLRADHPVMRARWGGGDAAATFAALRSAKDSF